MRLLHYPAAASIGQPSRAGAHTDYGNLTLLATDDVGGLEVRARSGDWIDAPVVEGAYVVNIGDCLMRWTNDVYVSTPHRVVNRSPRERYSIAFFYDPDPEAWVAAIPSCVRRGRGAAPPAAQRGRPPQPSAFMLASRRNCELGADPMLTTRQKVLRRFWYATERLDTLASGPKPFTLLGEKLVLFLDADGAPAALADRCLHRTAKLSKGWCENGELTCGYHGWTYDRTGKLIRVPQLAADQPTPALAVPSYRCEARYGFAWVSLDEPLLPIPEIPRIPILPIVASSSSTRPGIARR